MFSISEVIWMELLTSIPLNSIFNGSMCFMVPPKKQAEGSHCVNTRLELIGNTPLRQQLKTNMSSTEDAVANSCAEMLSRRGSAVCDAHQSTAV